LAFASFFLTLSSLPLYGLQIGSRAGSAGLVTTVMLASTVATQGVVPAATSRFSLVKVLAAGLILLGAPAPLYLVGHQFTWVLVVSAVRGIGFGVITVLMPLVASRLVPVGRRGEAIGIYGLAIAIPNLILVPAGVALTAGGQFRWVAIFAATPLLALPLVSSLSTKLRPLEPAGPSATVVAADPMAAIKAVAGTTLVLLSVTLAGGGVLTFLPVISPVGWVATVGLLTFGLTGALARWRVGRLSDRRGNKLLLPVSVLLAALGAGLIAAGLGWSSSPVVLAGAACLGLGYGAVQNVTLLVAFDRAGPANQSTASAVWNAAFDAGTAIGALLIGLVAASGPGFPLAFLGSALLILISLPLGLRAASAVR